MPILIGTRRPGQKAPPGTRTAGPSGLGLTFDIGATGFPIGGSGLDRRGGFGGPTGDTGEDMDRCLAGDISACERLLGGDGGDGGFGEGGFAPPAFGSTEAGLRLEAELAQQAAKEDFQRQLELQRMQQEFEKQQRLEELKAERERIFSEMLGTDPVRAALFAMGVGGEILPGGERFASLPPLQGAARQATQTSAALQQLLGGQQGTGQVALGEAGVTGLPAVEKAATAFSAGQRAGGQSVGDIGAARTLLGSAFGVGAIRGRGRPGLSREELLRRIGSVTPTGAF